MTQCPRCGSERIVRKLVASAGSAVSVPGSSKRVLQKCSVMMGLCCNECGLLFDFSLGDSAHNCDREIEGAIHG